MIFHFPNLETLRLALSSGQVTPEIARDHVNVAFAPAGSLSVETSETPPKAMQNVLKRLGVKVGAAHMGEPFAVGCWPEILPIVKETGTPEIAASAIVLFEFPVAVLPQMATEMLRLGNDRQSFRSFQLPGAGEPRVLLRVIGPPYYTLLRALDRLDAEVTAYLERAPRVWVEIGHTHPLAANLTVPEGRSLLLRPPRRWTMLEDEPFQDIYEILDFQLPSVAVEYAEGKLESKLHVPLRLAAGNAADAPEMWVLKDDAIQLFDAFVRDADERLMARLMFAVAETGEAGPTIILRVRALSKMTPPTVELSGAAGFTRYRKLNNLFVPAGTRLQPTLRRDAVRKMLAEDDSQIVWLTPLADGRFVPESLPDEAFRPLQDWVDYVIDRERQALQSWVQATTFDFDSFVCKGEMPDDPPPTSPEKLRARQSEPDAEPALDEASAKPQAAKGKKKAAPPKENDTGPSSPVAVPPSELKQRRDELETEFLGVDGPIEAPQRLALWPQLARINGALGDHAEAAICWLNGLWERDDLPADWLTTWLANEAGQAAPEWTAADWKLALANETPAQGDVRRLAAHILLSCARQPPSPLLQKRLPEVRRYLEKHDGLIGIRAAWLAWRHLTRLSGDLLGLARVRDRLIERLFKNGLKRPYDVPNFIHFAGQRDSDRLRRAQDHLLHFRGEVQAWLARQDDTKDVLHKTVVSTGWYADLIFAYGLAKLGDERHRSDLTASALARVRSNKPSNAKQERIPLFLADAFEFRIKQAVLGKEIGPLPSEILHTLDGMDPAVLYGINNLRKQLQVLEPHEKSDPYLQYKTLTDSSLIRDLAALQPLTDTKRLQTEIRRILGNNGRPLSIPDRAKVLTEVIPLTTRVGKDFAQEMLAHVLPALTSAIGKVKGAPHIGNEFELQAKLINVAVPIAANYDWPELVQQILTQFLANLRTLDEAAVIDSINLALGQWLRSLRRCGLKDQLHALLEDLTDLLLKGRSLETLRHEYSREANRKNWVDMLRSLLHLSECWIYFGGQSRAMPFIEEARLYLFDNQNKSAKDRPIATRYAPLASAYIRALGQLNDLDLIIERFSELLRRMDAIPNTQTTNALYSGLHLSIVESMVLALVSDDFILGETARRWLDDDEYLVRRRIHADMKKLLAQSGL